MILYDVRRLLNAILQTYNSLFEIIFAYSYIVQSNIYSYFAKINLTDCIIYYLQDTYVYLPG